VKLWCRGGATAAAVAVVCVRVPSCVCGWVGERARVRVRQASMAASRMGQQLLGRSGCEGGHSLREPRRRPRHKADRLTRGCATLAREVSHFVTRKHAHYILGREWSRPLRTGFCGRHGRCLRVVPGLGRGRGLGVHRRRLCAEAGEAWGAGAGERERRRVCGAIPQWRSVLI